MESNEVHICFDVPGIWQFNLKENVQQKRDSRKKSVPPLNETEIMDNTSVPSTANWTGFLANRDDKRKLVIYIGPKMLALQGTMEAGKVLIVRGCFSQNETYMIKLGSVAVISNLSCNHEEADTRLFAHAAWSTKNIIQFVAADTDILAILLLNHTKFAGKTTVIQYSEHKQKLDISKLVNFMHEDSDQDLCMLKSRGAVTIPFFFGMIHALTGSDLLCTPRGFGTSWILKTCIDFALYLFNNENGLQQLADREPRCTEAYTKFIIALYKKRYATKIRMKPEELLGTNVNTSEVLDQVRKDIWIYTMENNTMIPSKECLELHALNLSYQLQVWSQATKPTINVPDPKKFGWEQGGSGLTIMADTKNNMEKQASLYETIMKKCKCRRTQCKDGRCACRKDSRKCSSFCECLNCENTADTETKESEEADTDSDSESESDIEEEPPQDFLEDLDDDNTPTV